MEPNRTLATKSVIEDIAPPNMRPNARFAIMQAQRCFRCGVGVSFLPPTGVRYVVGYVGDVPVHAFKICLDCANALTQGKS